MGMYRSYHAADERGYHRPIHGGIMIGSPTFPLAAGTLGAVVTHRATGKKLIQYNQHQTQVLGKTLTQPNYNPATEPNVNEITIADNMAGIDANYKGIYLDVAIATLRPGTLVSHEIPGIGIPAGVVAPRRGMKVVGRGWATGLWRGTITNTNYTITSTAQTLDKVTAPRRRLTGIIVYSLDSYEHSDRTQKFGKGGRMDSTGNSGGIAFEQGTNNVVGILFGTIDGVGETMCSAQYAQEALGFDYVGKPGIFTEDGRPYVEAPNRPEVATTAPKPREVERPIPGGGIPIPQAAPVATPRNLQQLVPGIDNNVLLLAGGGLVILVAIIL